MSLGENQPWGFQIYIDVVLMVVRESSFWAGNTQGVVSEFLKQCDMDVLLILLDSAFLKMCLTFLILGYYFWSILLFLLIVVAKSF